MLLTQHINSGDGRRRIPVRGYRDADIIPCMWFIHTFNKEGLSRSWVYHGNVIPHPQDIWLSLHDNPTSNVKPLSFDHIQRDIPRILMKESKKQTKVSLTKN